MNFVLKSPIIAFLLLALVSSVYCSMDDAAATTAEEDQANVRGSTAAADKTGCRIYLEALVSNPSAEDPEDCENNVCGVVKFSCAEQWQLNQLTEIQYSISGLTPGQKHALHVHEFQIGTGDDKTCLSAGGHWNPEGVNHGGSLDAQRHIGDLGNILANENGVAEGTLLAYAPLQGNVRGIQGKSVVVHAGTDDLGTGGDDGSRAVGNAGARPACGNIE